MLQCDLIHLNKILKVFIWVCLYRNYKSEPIFPRNLWQNIVSVNWHHRKHLVFNRYLHYEKSFEKLFFEKNNKIMYWKWQNLFCSLGFNETKGSNSDGQKNYHQVYDLFMTRELPWHLSRYVHDNDFDLLKRFCSWYPRLFGLSSLWLYFYHTLYPTGDKNFR